ncbi:putative secreted protein [Wickerhamomyces ciferrii]|uniref:Secreted protein n=1 Tax=Wickerhamomyces ciferrii (strain ATCC 14091 / BCRC 22168 / CBS 111 / JCM 3599 / NBRC 0793 / NRRL Y-1031 F-60-10) TaxID=1206466 RepID=K0KID1_WICCF|nr:uncharacterized protein BN7_2295 [Wickerhamomyces ciferrii]CCH42751.1 putative secreted protein [Wickerhamomyces ciferrii]
MWVSLTILALFVQVIFAGSSVVVQLNTGNTIQDFLNQALVTTLKLQATTDNTVEIGGFKAFIGEFEESVIDQLKDDPIIQAIFPNVKINLGNDEDQGSTPDGTTVLSPQSSTSVGVPGPSIAAQGSSGNDSVSSQGSNEATTSAGKYTQNNAPRHLARLSSRHGIYNTSGSLKYNYDSLGKGVTAYVLDTGIAIKHPDFENRAKLGKTFVNESDGDNAGHGTNVAGIIGSKTYGVAKGISLVDVKVLGTNGGSVESILKGIEWATNDFKNSTSGAKAVINFSIQADINQAVNNALNAAYDEGIPVIAAAGNKNKDASGYTPGSAKEPIIVGALDDRSDTIALFSNWGSRVDIFASGVGVESTNYKDFNNPIAYYGTSQATPIITGLSALLLEQGTSAGDIKQKIIDLSTKNAISQETYDDNSNYDNTVNRVAYNGVNSDSSDKISNPSTATQDSTLKDYIE